MNNLNNEKIELLKEVLTDIEDQLKVREISTARTFARTENARNYYRGIEEGAYIALRILHERIGRLTNDCN